ncbi:MAG TPA: PorP/SprF family type IX secretion system membrane protein [Bacteroidales bacterium]|nr:PorP/SprF family type IX secretion system membrane protein [Bacteroidales bacterium]
MGLRKTITVFLLITNVAAAVAQDTWYGSATGMEMMYNPAFTGSAGEGTMKISCYSFLPGAGFGLQSVYASYDDFSQTLHGGAGLWVVDDMLGEVMNDLRAGMSYAYHLKAGRNLFFNAGLTASVIHRGINRGAVTFPGDFDPFGGLVSPPGETVTDAGTTLFDLGTGFTFSTGPWYGGFSVLHLATPYLGESSQVYNRLKRLYTINAGRVITPDGSDIEIRTSALLMLQDGNIITYLGASASFRELVFGMAGWYIRSGFSAIEPSAGWDSGSIRITLSYSYNLPGVDAAFPGTAVVKAGLSVSLNNVEKRKVIHVIKLPVL